MKKRCMICCKHWVKSEVASGLNSPWDSSHFLELESVGSTARMLARGKWRFRLGFPIRHVIILVVAIASWVGGRSQGSIVFHWISKGRVRFSWAHLYPRYAEDGFPKPLRRWQLKAHFINWPQLSCNWRGWPISLPMRVHFEGGVELAMFKPPTSQPLQQVTVVPDANGKTRASLGQYTFFAERP